MMVYCKLFLVLLLVGNADCFVPLGRRGDGDIVKSKTIVSSSGTSQLETNPSSLPPGRPTPRFFGFLFDDTVRLLNPKTMGSYQVKRRYEYGKIFKTNIFFGPAAVVVDIATLKEVANQEAVKKESMEAFFPPHHQKLFGPMSLLVQSGTTHEQLRRLVQPSLSPTSMKMFQPTVDAALDSLLDRLPRTYTDKIFAVVPELRDFFIEIALNILLGSKASSTYSKEEISELATDISTWAKGLVSAPLTFIPWSTAAKAARARKRIVVKLQAMIEDERSNPSDDSLLGRLCAEQDDDDDDGSMKQLSTDAIIDNVLTLIFAGSDTTASAATSLWMTLSQRPDVKERIRSDPGLAPVLVAKILQMYPPAPFQMRLVKEDIPVADYTIPAGWLVVYGFAGSLHESNPSPDWFDGVTGKGASGPESSMAFGTGPRMCPGRYLASLELTSLCQKLVQLDWSLAPDQNLEQRYTPGYFPKDGLKIAFKS